MATRRRRDRFSIDHNGCLTERVTMDGTEVVIHYDDIPESDITLIDGMRVTTALRTVIDIAADVDAIELDEIITHCLDRGLFTRDEALARVTEPDLRHRTGARLLHHALTA